MFYIYICCIHIILVVFKLTRNRWMLRGPPFKRISESPCAKHASPTQSKGTAAQPST